MDEISETDLWYYKTTITEPFLSDISKSPQFAYFELAFTPVPKIKDALNLRGSVKHQILKK